MNKWKSLIVIIALSVGLYLPITAGAYPAYEVLSQYYHVEGWATTGYEYMDYDPSSGDWYPVIIIPFDYDDFNETSTTGGVGGSAEPDGSAYSSAGSGASFGEYNFSGGVETFAYAYLNATGNFETYSDYAVAEAQASWIFSPLYYSHWNFLMEYESYNYMLFPHINGATLTDLTSGNILIAFGYDNSGYYSESYDLMLDPLHDYEFTISSHLEAGANGGPFYEDEVLNVSGWAIPEPTTLLLLGLGITGLAVLRRKS